MDQESERLLDASGRTEKQTFLLFLFISISTLTAISCHLSGKIYFFHFFCCIKNLLHINRYFLSAREFNSLDHQSYVLFQWRLARSLQSFQIKSLRKMTSDACPGNHSRANLEKVRNAFLIPTQSFPWKSIMQLVDVNRGQDPARLFLPLLWKLLNILFERLFTFGLEERLEIDVAEGTFNCDERQS